MYFRVLICCIVFLSGCAINGAPYIAYDDIHHPLQDTAVVTTMQEKLLSYRGRSVFTPGIVSVNGKKVTCTVGACSALVRVLPGKNTIELNVFEGPVELENLQPKHVYRLVFSIKKNDTDDTGLILYLKGVEDLGESPDFGITLGLKGVNQKFHPVKFQ